MEEKFTCPRRHDMAGWLGGQPPPFAYDKDAPDEYKSGHGIVGQKRGCSYCGSMPSEDFMQAVRDGVEVGPSDKAYKFYMDKMKGKFYTQHLTPEQGWEFHELWQAKKINWGYPGHAYVRLYLPGPSTGEANPTPPTAEDENW